MNIVFKQAEYLRHALFDAGYVYAKECFLRYNDDGDIDDETPLLPDGRVNPSHLAIEDASYEIIGYSDYCIPLDKTLFPDYKDGDSVWPYIHSFLKGEDPSQFFLMGERAYIDLAYGINWVERYPLG